MTHTEVFFLVQLIIFLCSVSFFGFAPRHVVFHCISYALVLFLPATPPSPSGMKINEESTTTIARTDTDTHTRTHACTHVRYSVGIQSYIHLVVVLVEQYAALHSLQGRGGEGRAG